MQISEEIRKGGLWVVAFTGVCILVGLGKLEPKTIEYLLFALVGAMSNRKERTDAK